jgi:hypothetical protein
MEMHVLHLLIEAGIIKQTRASQRRLEDENPYIVSSEEHETSGSLPRRGPKEGGSAYYGNQGRQGYSE